MAKYTSKATVTLHLHWDGATYDLHSQQQSGSCEKSLYATVVALKQNKIYEGIFCDDQSVTENVAGKQVILKIDTTVKDITDLEWEYEIYERLGSLQGTAVPHFFGLFQHSDTKKKIACLVLEKCIPSGVIDDDEFHRQTMVIICKIHGAGVYHGQLDSERHIIRQGACPRIVDFSKAGLHDCMGGYPVNQRAVPRIPYCQELFQMESSKIPSASLESEALIMKPIEYLTKALEKGSTFMGHIARKVT